MQLVRYLNQETNPQYGWIYEGMVGGLLGNPFDDYRRLEVDTPLEKVRLLAPVMPGKIICMGRNYVEHAKEQNVELPSIPLIFLKPPSTVIGPGDTIILPPQSQRVEHEAELAVVIGKRGRWISPERALMHVLGYTIANDVTARDLQRADGQWTRGKGFDTFCPLGPYIDTNLEPSDLTIACRVNDELRQMASTRDMVFSIPQIIAFISSVMTLEPGDIILTGTPSGIGELKEGDQVTITIDGLGELSNPVASQN